MTEVQSKTGTGRTDDRERKRASKTATDTVESARGAALRAAMREYRADPAGRGGLQGTGGTLRDHHRLPYRADPA
jgi:hypothetical protein